MVLRRLGVLRRAAAAALLRMTVLLSLATPAVAADSLRVALLLEPGFPAVGAPAADPKMLRGALAGLAVSELDSRALAARLRPDAFDVLVLPYGAAFPEEAWPAIERFLAAGGRWVNLGGAPLAAPVVRDGAGWRVLTARTAYPKALGIVQSYPVAAAGLHCRATAAGSPELCDTLTTDTVHELIVRLTTSASSPSESGSDGEREARVDALAHLFGDDELPLSAPLVRIDRLQGRFAGGRWVLATGDRALPPATVRRLVEDAAAGASELSVRPAMAGFLAGETPAVAIRWSTPGRASGATAAAVCRVMLRDPAGAVAATREVALVPDGGALAARVELPLPVGAATGLWMVRAELAAGGRAAAATTAESGFWLYTPTMVAGGTPLRAGARYLERGGKPFPVIGTTYMAGDAHRRFLLAPNPAVWERDFAAMARSGVNLVRTGIWTRWRDHCAAGPQPREEVLRALETFVLTARAHEIPVIFTFFAFVPETWGATNPYLDPAAVAAQSTFVTAFARRLAGAEDVAWDLINEPSFSSPSHLWQCRPNGDAHEAAAWTRWTREALVAGAADPEAALADRWNLVTGESLGLPTLADFGDRNLLEAARPRKAADYKRFAQDAFAGWTRGLTAALRAAGNPRALVTVGQDEGGIAESPSSLEFGEHVDFTCNHTWWLNDALLWDSLITRLPDRPNLIEETGVMTVEKLDGSGWRTEEDARDLLERKLVTALGAGTAGAVQWLWNTNVYMPIDNEAGIGLLRAAGTAKPEQAAFAAIARFVSEHAARFAGAVDEDVVVVVPHSQMQSARDLGTAATQRAVRVLEYDLRVPVRLVSETGLRRLKPAPKLVVLPAPRVLRESAWRDLLALAEGGATVLLTGTFDRDEVERPVKRAASLGVSASVRPVVQEETVVAGGAVVAARFRGNRVERAEKALLADGVSSLRSIPRGAGSLLWCPVPVELAEGPEATSAVYAATLAKAGVTSPLDVRASEADVLIRPVVLADTVLVALVNESDAERTVSFRLRTAVQEIALTLAPRRSVLALLARSDGRLLGRT
jgi:hypothetical protein